MAKICFKITADMNENCHKTYLRYFYDNQSQSIAKQTEWASFELRGGGGGGNNFHLPLFCSRRPRVCPFV